MAENLNYETEDSFCFDKCDVYGRFYSLNSAENACPEGWRLPSESEWNTLYESVGGTPQSVKNLLSAVGGWYIHWGVDEKDSVIEEDMYGFSVIAACAGFLTAEFDC